MDSSSSTDHAKIQTTISTCPNSSTHDESLFSSYIPVISVVTNIVFRSIKFCLVIGQFQNKIEDKSQCWFCEMYKLWMVNHWSLNSFSITWTGLFSVIFEDIIKDVSNKENTNIALSHFPTHIWFAACCHQHNVGRRSIRRERCHWGSPAYCWSGNVIPINNLNSTLFLFHITTRTHVTFISFYLSLQ